MFPEVEFKRAQFLSYEGQALAHLVFETSTGALALCIIRANAQADSALASMEMEGMQSAHWGLNGYEYLLIGGKDQGLIDRVATSLVRPKSKSRLGDGALFYRLKNDDINALTHIDFPRIHPYLY